MFVFECLRKCFHVQAGPERCALASSRSTALTISDEIDALLAKLYDRPLAVPKAVRPGILTSSMIEGLNPILADKTMADMV